MLDRNTLEEVNMFSLICLHRDNRLSFAPNGNFYYYCKAALKQSILLKTLYKGRWLDFTWL